MNKITKAFVAATIIGTSTLGTVGTAHAADSKTPTDHQCYYAGYWFSSGSAVKTADGRTLYCVDGFWVSTGPQVPGGKPVSAPKSPVGVLTSIFAR
ncbi:MAG: hypothetical protein WDO12_00110 [Pseudomonadota bacterium]